MKIFDAAIASHSRNYNNPLYISSSYILKKIIHAKKGVGIKRRAYTIDFALIKPDIDVWMHKSFINRDSFFWIDDQHLLQEITCHVCLQSTVLRTISWKEDIWKKLLKLITSILWTIFHIVSYSWLQAFHEVLQWCTQLLDYFVPLINILVWVKEIQTTEKHLKNVML